MAVRHYTLTLTGVAQRLSSALSPSDVGGAADEAMRLIALQPDKGNSNDVYVGAATLTSSDYGVRLDPGDTAPPVVLGHFDTGPYKLSEFYVLGTNNEKLHVLAIPF